MILIEQTIFDEFARLANYNYEVFLDKVYGYAENALGIKPESSHPFWDNLNEWVDENRDMFDDLMEQAV